MNDVGIDGIHIRRGRGKPRHGGCLVSHSWGTFKTADKDNKPIYDEYTWTDEFVSATPEEIKSTHIDLERPADGS